MGHFRLGFSRKRILRSSEALPLQDLIPNFPWHEYKEDNRFTLLHEIVCGISGLDLDSALRTRLADIDRLDCKGKSPLEYAVLFGNITAVQTLLRRGANPMVSNGAPVCEAFTLGSAKTVEMTELLLHSGATVNGTVGYETAKYWMLETCSFGDPWVLALDKLLIEHGMDVNLQINCGEIMLMKLCTSWIRIRSIDRLEQLISYGANLELRNKWGATALHVAVANQNIKALKAIIQAGARLDAISDQGEVIAHSAVIFSRSANFVRALFEVDLARLNLDQRNENGHTAYDLLRKRNGLRWEKYNDELRKKYYDELLDDPYEKLMDQFFDSMGYDCFPRGCRARKDEYEIILALEAPLHQIQDSQAIPKDQQYPPLGPYLSDDKDDDPVPGAWPV